MNTDWREEAGWGGTSEDELQWQSPGHCGFTPREEKGPEGLHIMLSCRSKSRNMNTTKWSHFPSNSLPNFNVK
jgi:hypothetical protein